MVNKAVSSGGCVIFLQDNHVDKARDTMDIINIFHNAVLMSAAGKTVHNCSTAESTYLSTRREFLP